MTKDDKKKTVEETYKKMTHHEHVLAEPDNYIGSISPDTMSLWIYDEEVKHFIMSSITIAPGLYKIFDEILTNARDHGVRDKKCRTIKVNIDKTTGEISVWNDGTGIPVAIHKDHKVYIASMIFGDMLTSSNYNNDKKITGGKNGIGSKAANIFSKLFMVETVDNENKKKFTQTFRNNMYVKEDPIIKNISGDEKSYTKITFIPDYERFKMKGLTNEVLGLFKKRVYDIAACCPKGMKVYLNNELINFKDFKDYITMFYDKKPKDLVYEEFSDRWKVGVVFDPDAGFTQMSFVNGIWTFRGGKHVDYIVNQIVEKITEYIKKKHKGLKVRPEQIKTNITVFIDSVIEGPSFNSQTKEELTKKVSEFGSKCIISDQFINDLTKTDLIEEVVRIAEFKELGALKKTDGKKQKSLKAYDKLEDAKWAGTAKSDQTLLILTEGDSAKAFALEGIQILGNEKYGVFPLKGKLLNVRNATIKQIKENEEFIALKQILGLKQGNIYKSTKELRYGGIMILTDADADGSHIKGLIINMFEHFWPSLIMHDGFINSYSTPLVKAIKKTDKKHENVKKFFSITEMQNWIDNELKGDTGGWDIKYYKGLGTHEANEAQECFIDFEKKITNFVWEKDKKIKDKEKENEKEKENSDESSLDKYENSMSHKAIVKAFDKKLANARKDWLSNYNPQNMLDTSIKTITYDEFIDKELIHFSNYDNIRSLPSVCDALKPSLRKVLFAMFRRGKKAGQIKVSQFAGYVSQHTEYHHGEDSLNKAIIGLAQNFPGSNNINYLLPLGNFGYRRQNGEEHASPRYIFTNINPLTLKLFREEDAPILQYQEEDGSTIEPVVYAPILPNILINGAKGIGTGYSSTIPNYNPEDVAEYILNIINNKQQKDLIPWFRGFIGKIKSIEDNKFKMSGVYEIIDQNNVHITEIPIFGGKSIEDYKSYLTSLTILDKKDNDDSKKRIENFDMKPNNNKIDIMVTFKSGQLQKLLKMKPDNEELERYLKLNTTISTSNYILYNNNGKITKYDDPESIIDDFYEFRYNMYEKRKKFRIRLLENELDIIKYKIKYIRDIIADPPVIVVKKQKRNVVIERLKKLKYPMLSISINPKDYDKKNDKDDKKDIEEEDDIDLEDIDNEIDNNEDEENIVKEDRKYKKSYKYLTDMLIFAQTEEKIAELENQFENKEAELLLYKKTPIEEIWKREIEEFLEAYHIWKKELEDKENSTIGKKKSDKKTKVKKTNSLKKKDSNIEKKK